MISHMSRVFLDCSPEYEAFRLGLNILLKASLEGMSVYLKKHESGVFWKPDLIFRLCPQLPKHIAEDGKVLIQA